MRKFVLSSLLALGALNAFAHAGEVHKYMGTVSSVHENGAFMLETTDGKSIHVEVSKTTVYRNLDGSGASPADVVAGRRVVATISTDGKTATEIRIGAKSPA